MVIRVWIKAIITTCVALLVFIIIYIIAFHIAFHRLPWDMNDEVEIESFVTDMDKAIIVDKYDYIDYDNKYKPDVYILVVNGKNKDGKECKYNVRVTLGAFLSSNIGDKFDMRKHERK